MSQYLKKEDAPDGAEDDKDLFLTAEEITVDLDLSLIDIWRKLSGASPSVDEQTEENALIFLKSFFTGDVKIFIKIPLGSKVFAPGRL